MEDYLTRWTQSISEFVPGIIGAVLLLLVAWLVSTIVRAVVQRIGRASKLDTRLHSPGITETAGQICYWLVFLIFIPGILSALRLETVLVPIQGMLNRLLGFLPNLLGAGLILLVGWFIARLLGRISTSLLAVGGVDQLGQRLGIPTARPLSTMLGLLVYILILIPVITASLNTLGLAYVAGPLSAMLNNFLLAIPNIFAAAVLIAISLVLARIVRQITSALLTAMGFNKLPAHLGLGGLAATARSSPADTLGNLVFTAIMLFASMEAARLLQFVFIANLINRLLIFAGQVILGLVIFAFGLYLAQMAARAIHATGTSQARSLALVAQSAILFLVIAMALAEMGLARDIVNLAFGLLLGSLAVAGALAFGLGGRQTASRILERWEQSHVSRRVLDVNSRSGSSEITA